MTDIEDDDFDLDGYWKDVRVPPPPKVYEGSRDKDNALVVTVRQGNKVKKLSPKRSQRIYNHSPNGFECGYAGSGPAQLALAIILDAFPNEDKDWVLRRYQVFKAKVIAKLPRDGSWVLPIDQVNKAIRAIDDHLGDRAT